jgi:hypothetical protein
MNIEKKYLDSPTFPFTVMKGIHYTGVVPILYDIVWPACISTSIVYPPLLIRKMIGFCPFRIMVDTSWTVTCSNKKEYIWG